MVPPYARLVVGTGDGLPRHPLSAHHMTTPPQLGPGGGAHALPLPDIGAPKSLHTLLEVFMRSGETASHQAHNKEGLGFPWAVRSTGGFLLCTQEMKVQFLHCPPLV